MNSSNRKRCSCCQKVKPLDEFSKNPASKDKFNYRCKECRAQAQAKYYYERGGKQIQAQWYHEQGGKQIQAKYKRSTRGREVQAQAKARYYYERGGKEIQARYCRSTRGRTVQERASTLYNFGDVRLLLLKSHLLRVQFNRCPICMRSATEINQVSEFHWDHCHSANKLRGLLCEACNTRLGLWKADTLEDAWAVFDKLQEKDGPKGQKLLRAVKYFHESTCQKIGLQFTVIGRLSSKKYTKKQTALIRQQSSENLSKVLERYQLTSKVAA